MSKSDLPTSAATIAYSEEEIFEALRPRALPIYTKEETAIREAILSIGAQHISGRRKGGLTDRKPAIDAACRQAAIVAIYRALPQALSKTPTGTRTINAIHRKLEQKGFSASVETIERDIKALGTGALRGQAEPQNRRPWFTWLAPERSKARKKSFKH
jgi:hypothetical protein